MFAYFFFFFFLNGGGHPDHILDQTRTVPNVIILILEVGIDLDLGSCPCKEPLLSICLHLLWYIILQQNMCKTF